MKKPKSCFKGCLIVILSIFVLWGGSKVYSFVSDKITGHRYLGSDCYGMEWSSDGRYLYYSKESSKDSLFIFDTKEYSLKKIGHYYGTHLLPDNKNVVYIDEDNQLIKRNIFKGNSSIIFKNINKSIETKRIFYLSNDKYLLTGKDLKNTGLEATYLIDTNKNFMKLIVSFPALVVNTNYSGFCYNDEDIFYYYDLQKMKSFKLQLSDLIFDYDIFYIKNDKILYSSYKKGDKYEENYLGCYDINSMKVDRIQIPYRINGPLMINNQFYFVDHYPSGDFPYNYLLNPPRTDIYRTPKSIVDKINKLLK